MELTNILDAYHANGKAIAKHFGLHSLDYYFCDLRSSYWRLHNDHIVYADDPAWFDANGYDGHIYGTSRWSEGGYTLLVVVSNGEKEMWLFDDHKRVKHSEDQ